MEESEPFCTILFIHMVSVPIKKTAIQYKIQRVNKFDVCFNFQHNTHLLL
jgi:hypothetical protein